MLTGTSPREYVADIRTTIVYILSILVTRQRPKFMLKDPRYRHAKGRVSQLGLLARVRADADALFSNSPIDEADLRNLPSIDGAIMEAMRVYTIAVAQMRTATRNFAF